MADYNYLARGIGPALQEGAQAAYMGQHGDYWNARAGMYGQGGGNPFAHLPADTQKHLSNVAGWVGDETGAILQAPEADQPALYAAALQRAKAQGIPGTETWPQAWGPEAKNFAVLNRAHAAHVTEWLAPQKAPKAGRGGGGGGAPAGDGLEPMASAAPPGGGDTAVADAGPPTPAPTQTAQMLATPQAAPPPGPSGPVVADVAPVGGAAPPNAGGYGAGEPPEIGAGEGFGAGAQPAPPPDMGALGPPSAALQSPGGVRPQGNIWNTDPSQYGGVLMGHRLKPGAPLLPADVGGHFVYKLPPDGEHPQGQTVLYKPAPQPPAPDKYTDQYGPDGKTLIGQRGPDNKYYPISQKPSTSFDLPPELQNVHGDEFRNSEFYQKQNGILKNNVEGALSGDVPISVLSKRVGGGADFQTIVGMARQIDPKWSPNEGQQRQIFEKGLADGNTKNGQAVQAINIAPLHAVDLLKITDAINQQNPTPVQGIINNLKQKFGDTAVPDMNAARNLVSLEFLRAAVGPGALNQTLEQQFVNSINTAGTSDQVRRVVAGYTDKLLGRAHEMIDTGKEYNKDFKDTMILHPRTQEALDFIKGPRQQNGQSVAPQPSWWQRTMGGGSTGEGGAPAVRSYDPATGTLK